MYQLASYFYLSALGQINKNGVKASSPMLGDPEIEEIYIGKNRIVFMKAISGKCDQYPTTSGPTSTKEFDPEEVTRQRR